MLDDPDWNVTFAPNGKLLEEGEILRRPEFSKTLERIAKEGVEAFYTVCGLALQEPRMQCSSYRTPKSNVTLKLG